MQFENTFCSSPWIHMRITNQGYYNFCRWETYKIDNTRPNIKNIELLEYFQKYMQQVRKSMIDGNIL